MRNQNNSSSEWEYIKMQVMFMGPTEIHLVRRGFTDTGAFAQHLILPRWAVVMVDGDTGDLSESKWDRKQVMLHIHLGELTKAIRRVQQ